MIEEHEEEEEAFEGIPIRNLWLLLLYASNLYRTLGPKRSGIEENPDDIPDLVGELLCRAVSQRLRRALTRKFERREGVLTRVRGRINLRETEVHQLLLRGKVACRFEELTLDTARNRFVCAALRRLASVIKKNQRLAQSCRSLSAQMVQAGVGTVCPTRSEMSGEQYGRNDLIDRTMVDLAQLAFDLALLTEAVGQSHGFEPDRDPHWLRRLFERAVAGFYAVRLPEKGWEANAGKHLHWQIEESTGRIVDILPEMKTDIILTHVAEGRRIVVDTKFTSILKAGRHRDWTLSSAYLYQIYSYVESQSGRGDLIWDRSEGVLLHPSTGTDIFEAVTIQGHQLKFATVDLTRPASDIAEQLLRITFP